MGMEEGMRTMILVTRAMHAVGGRRKSIVALKDPTWPLLPVFKVSRVSRF